MKSEHYRFLVKSANPPTIEFDSRAGAVYVRFKKAAVAKTIGQGGEGMHVAVDLDSKGEVIGIEALGAKQFTIAAILRRASVDAPHVDFARARHVASDLVGAPE